MIKNQLSEKYEKDKKFQDEMNKINKQYNQTYGYALYTDFQKTKASSTIKIYGSDNQGDLVILYLGHMQTNEKDSAHKTFCYFIKMMEQKFFENQTLNKKLFSIVFFNNLCKGDGVYNNMKNSLKKLPLKYFQRLKKIILIKPSFTIRNMDFLVSGPINKFIKQKTIMIYTLKDLHNHQITLDNKLFNLLPQDLKSNDPPIITQTLVTGKRMMLGATKKTFIETKTEFHTSLDQYQICQLGVPTILKFMIMFLKNNPKFLQQEGIFRKSVSIDDQNQVLAHLLQSNYDHLDQVTNPHIIASLIKKFLTKLDPPLFNYLYYQTIMNEEIQTQNNISLIQCIVKIIKKQAPINYTILMFLGDFMVNQIISRENQNKMSFHNVGVVLTPCFLRSNKVSLLDIQFEGKMRAFIQLMLRNFQKIFGNKKAQNAIYHASIKMKQQQWQQQNKLIDQAKQPILIEKKSQKQIDKRPQIPIVIQTKDISRQVQQVEKLPQLPQNNQKKDSSKREKYPSKIYPQYNKNILNHQVSFQLPMQELLDVQQDAIITLPKTVHREAMLEKQQHEVKQWITMTQSKIKIAKQQKVEIINRKAEEDSQQFQIIGQY